MTGIAAWVAWAGFDAGSAPGCATTISALRTLLAEPDFPLRWYETTMDDGKPLVLSILEREGTLCLEFMKTGEGLWVEATCAICRGGSGLEARFTADQVRIGPACNFIARLNLSGGGQVSLTRLDAARLRVDANGWNGIFSPREAKRT
jgi:hypothetical protein